MGRHVLLLAYAFPPSAEIGARRALRMARGLETGGFRVTVLSVEDRFAPILDARLGEAAIPLEVVRTRTLDPIAWAKRRPSSATDGHPGAPAVSRRPAASGRLGALQRVASALLQRVLVPDPMIGWAPPAMRAAAAVHARAPIDVVLATLPPYSALVPAAAIARRTGARLVVDYRDPWAADRRAVRSGPERWALDRLEARLLRGAALVLFTSEPARDFYRARYPFLRRTEVLYNGIDAMVPAGPPVPQSPLVWAHAGSLYQGRSLEGVVRALAAAKDVDARLLLVGDEPGAELSLAETLGVRDRIEWIGRRSFVETQARLRGAHRLVAVISDAHPFSIPAKVFDYLATSRPILLLAAPDHPAARLLAAMPGHRILGANDVAALAEVLEADAADARAGGLPDLERRHTEPYEAARQMQNLCRWLDDAVEPR